MSKQSDRVSIKASYKVFEYYPSVRFIITNCGKRCCETFSQHHIYRNDSVSSIVYHATNGPVNYAIPPYPTYACDHMFVGKMNGIFKLYFELFCTDLFQKAHYFTDWDQIGYRNFFYSAAEVLIRNNERNERAPNYCKCECDEDIPF